MSKNEVILAFFQIDNGELPAIRKGFYHFDSSNLLNLSFSVDINSKTIRDIIHREQLENCMYKCYFEFHIDKVNYRDKIITNECNIRDGKYHCDLGIDFINPEDRFIVVMFRILLQKDYGVITNENVCVEVQLKTNN